MSGGDQASEERSKANKQRFATMQRDVLWIALHSARVQTVLFLFQRGNSIDDRPLEITGLTFDHGVKTCGFCISVFNTEMKRWGPVVLSI